MAQLQNTATIAEKPIGSSVNTVVLKHKVRLMKQKESINGPKYIQELKI